MYIGGYWFESEKEKVEGVRVMFFLLLGRVAG